MLGFLMVTAKDERGRLVRKPTPKDIRGMVKKLGPRNTFLIVSDGDRYVQTRLRETGKLDLEYRDGTASEHYQATSVPREKVIAAMSGWLADEADWKDAFKWTNIGHWFSDAPMFVVWGGPSCSVKKAEARYQQIQKDDDLVLLGKLDRSLQRFVRALRRKHRSVTILPRRGGARALYSHHGIVVVFDDQPDDTAGDTITGLAMDFGLTFYDIREGLVCACPPVS